MAASVLSHTCTLAFMRTLVFAITGPKALVSPGVAQDPPEEALPTSNRSSQELKYTVPVKLVDEPGVTN